MGARHRPDAQCMCRRWQPSTAFLLRQYRVLGGVPIPCSGRSRKAFDESAGSNAGKTPVETPVKTPIAVLQSLAANPTKTLAEVAAETGKSLSAVERASAKLVKDGKLKYVGPKKGGHWEILT